MRRRFLEHRLCSLHDELRAGKHCTIDDERVAELIHKTLHTTPADSRRTEARRTISAESAIPPASVHRHFKPLHLHPHHSECFKLSTDPYFIEKLRLNRPGLPGDSLV